MASHKREQAGAGPGSEQQALYFPSSPSPPAAATTTATTTTAAAAAASELRRPGARSGAARPGCGTCSLPVPRVPVAYELPRLSRWLKRKERRVWEHGELCSFADDAGTHYFVHANIELPITGAPVEGAGSDTRRVFTWVVWVNVSKTSFGIVRAWNEAHQKDEPVVSTLRPAQDDNNTPVCFGWLSVELEPFYGSPTLFTKCRVHLRTGRRRPWVEIQPSEHMLSRQQRLGISWKEVLQIHRMTTERISRETERTQSNAIS